MKLKYSYLFIACLWLALITPLPAADGLHLNKLDFGAGKGDDSEHLELNGSVYSQISERAYLQLGLGRLEFEDFHMNELGAYLFRRGDNNMLALGYKRQELDVFTSNHAILQYQYYQDELLSVVGTLGHEDKKFVGDYSYGALYLRLYPLKNLMLQTGPRYYGQLGDNFGGEDIELDLYIEWRPDIDVLSHFSVFYEENIFDDKLIGIRYRSRIESLIDSHRAGGILGI